MARELIARRGRSDAHRATDPCSRATDDFGRRLRLPVVAGFSTHPHFDHLLWHPRFGDVPRYANLPRWFGAAVTA